LIDEPYEIVIRPRSLTQVYSFAEIVAGIKIIDKIIAAQIVYVSRVPDGSQVVDSEE